jgi:flavin-dependent dehydrogenase
MVTRFFDCDVCIAGGGPAGLAAAIAAARRGLSVTVIDAAEPPLDKACGEGLMPDALLALGQLGVDLDDALSTPFRGVCFTGYGWRAEALFPNGTGRGIRRPVLHKLLAEYAETLGVRFLWHKRITALDGHYLTLDSELIHARWIVGADGLQSRIRRWARLDANTTTSSRVGRRLHYRAVPWSRCVEIYWGEHGQAYVTPVAPDEVCVAFIGRKKHTTRAFTLEGYPELKERLKHADVASALRGAMTVGRTLHRVAAGHVALIGDASGSVDAITGEGLALSFRQALALGDALVHNDLNLYERAHRSIGRVPSFMSRTMLLLDGSQFLRLHTLQAFERSPQLFARMLGVHVGAFPLRWLGDGGVLRLGWGLITA